MGGVVGEVGAGELQGEVLAGGIGLRGFARTAAGAGGAGKEGGADAEGEEDEENGAGQVARAREPSGVRGGRSASRSGRDLGRRCRPSALKAELLGAFRPAAAGGWRRARGQGSRRRGLRPAGGVEIGKASFLAPRLAWVRARAHALRSATGALPRRDHRGSARAGGEGEGGPVGAGGFAALGAGGWTRAERGDVSVRCGCLEEPEVSSSTPSAAAAAAPRPSDRQPARARAAPGGER